MASIEGSGGGGDAGGRRDRERRKGDTRSAGLRNKDAKYSRQKVNRIECHKHRNRGSNPLTGKDSDFNYSNDMPVAEACVSMLINIITQQ